MKFGVACRGETTGFESVAFDEDFDEVGGAGGGEFPVRAIASGVDRYVVGVSFDTQGFGAGFQDRGEAVDGVFRGGPQVG